MTKRRDLRPAKSTRNCGTTCPTKVLLPRSCPIDLEAKQRFASGCNIYRSSRVRALIPRNLQEKSTGPTGSEHESLESLKSWRRIVRDYKFLHDVRRYLRVVRRRIGHHASTKGLVPPEEGMRKITVFTQLLPSTELLHPRVRTYVLQKIILLLMSSYGDTNKNEFMRQEDGSRLSLQCESNIKNSYFRAGEQIAYSRFQLIQVIFTSQTYESCHPSTCKARILNLPRPKKNPKKETSERRPVYAKLKGPATDKLVFMPTEASSITPSGLAPTRENYFRPRAP
ncbi:hypothetical protein F2Q69_00043070 [Brassica cretica]|uniref:Uncharacterized protein n=1 Tax=Brassica cretica TaxID=69181 RepID=A0A8S9NPT1_BRACR|nr:hypothetical protein F2Q69_00043070 [Brassica cretica]